MAKDNSATAFLPCQVKHCVGYAPTLNNWPVPFSDGASAERKRTHRHFERKLCVHGLPCYCRDRVMGAVTSDTLDEFDMFGCSCVVMGNLAVEA